MNTFAVRCGLRTSSLAFKHAQPSWMLRGLHLQPKSGLLRTVPPVHTTPLSRTVTFSAARSLQGSPILQFFSSRLRHATHRSRSLRPSSHTGGQRSPPPDLNADGPPRQVIFWGILVLNGVVYLAWQRSSYEWTQNRDPSLHRWLADNFTVSMHNFREGRVWTLLTACFSHEGTAHIFMNAFTFYFMAPTVISMLGTRSFLTLYLGGGLVSSLISLWFNNSARPGQRSNYSSHGASGAIYSVVSFFACVAPRAQFALFGIVPLPAWLVVSGVFLIDGYSALNNKQAGTDTAGHVGGILGGIGYFLCKRFRIF